MSSENDTMMVFSGAQTVHFGDEQDPEVIWDSGSTIMLAKDENLLEKSRDVKSQCVRMVVTGVEHNTVHVQE